MRKPFKPKLTIAVAHLATTLFSAELYDPQLGKGVNFSETQTLGTCIEYDKKNLLMNEKTLKREFTENRVRSREEMGKTLNVDVAVSAKGLWGSASGSVAVFNQSRFNEENFYWIVDANYQIGSQSIDTASHKFKLTEEAQKILKAHGWSGFVKACGTHFYGGVVLGARYTLLYEFSHSQDQAVSRLAVKAGYGGFGVKADAAFSQATDSFKDKSRLKVHVHSYGGDSSVAEYLEEYKTNPSKIHDQLEKLRTGLLDEKLGKAVQWFAVPYTVISEVQGAIKDDDFAKMIDEFRDTALGKYYARWRSNEAQISRIGNLLERTLGEEPFYIFKDEDIDHLEAIRGQIEDQNEEIQRLAKGCLRQTNKCELNTDAMKLVKFKFPRPERDLSTMGGWNVVPDRSPNSKVFANFKGRPPSKEGTDYDARLFLTKGIIFAPNETVLLMPNAGGYPIHIGYTDQVVDPATGKGRPNICVGDLKDICNLRIVENPTALTDDGYSASKLQLTFWDKFGFIQKQFEFLPWSQIRRLK